MIMPLRTSPESESTQPAPSTRRRVLLAMYWWEERVFDGVARFATEHNWILDSRMRWSHSDDYLPNWKVHGIIANPGSTRPMDSILTLIEKSQLPTVGLQKFGDYKCDARVMLDHRGVGREGARHLISREFRNLAFVKFADNELENERCRGFKEITREAGVHFHEIKFSELHSRLQTLPRPIGLMATNDINALEVMSVCLESGFSIPDDIAIIGADDSKAFCEHLEVPLSSVRCQFEEQGYRAAATLEKIMSHETLRETEIVIAPQGVTSRASTDTIGTQDSIARKTLAIIRERFREQLKVKEIAELAGLSPRRLQVSFRESLGFTMSTELIRLRINHAKFLLRESDQKIDSVAYECGFSSRHHFIRSFSREMGMTPTDYRLQVGQT